MSFAPNGLLSKPVELVNAPSNDKWSSGVENDASFSFVPNGLLSGTRDTDSLTTLVSDSSSESNATPLHKSSDICDAEMVLDTSSLEENTTVNDHSPLLPSQTTPFTYESTSQDRVDSRLVRCKNFDGRLVFFARRQNRDKHAPVAANLDGSLGNLLDVPLHRLMDELAAQAQDISLQASSLPTQSNPSKSPLQQEDMWVDRYRPQKFVDLAGDERVNRETLSWVKEWDQCVFKTRKRKNKRKREDEEFDPKARVDPFGRPKEKILLISGPPGLGKTTLAHVAAKQAGYKVLEINASDARSGSVIDDRIRPALESGKAVNQKDDIPTLVVIDEVDGATGENSSGFINKLISLTYDPPKKKAPGQRTGRRPLMRPIICICNDLYAPALAKLRLHARIIRMHPSTSAVLSKRLSSICEMEDLKYERRALNALVEICQGDVRSCLNTLQFIKTKSASVTESVVRSSTVGVKESETSVQSVWSDLFTPVTKKKAKSLGWSSEDEAKWVGRLVRSVESSGNVEKIALGAFEHYTTLHQHDPSLKRFEASNDWLSTYDLFNSTARLEQEYALQPYFSYTVVPLFHHMSSSGNAKVEKPSEYWDSVTKAKACQETAALFKKTILHPEGGRTQQSASSSADYRHLLSKECVFTEFIPLLNRVIAPPIRPVNKQVIKAEEKIILSRLVEVMVSTGLRFQQDKTEDGQLVYRMEPAIDDFIVYDGKRATDIGASRYAVRHMIAAEIDGVLAARQNQVIEKSSTGGSRMFGGSRKDKESEQGTDAIIDICDKPVVDFFGRPIILQPVPHSQPSDSPSTSKKPRVDAQAKSSIAFSVNYKYYEGNSSAVRKPTKVSTFL